MLASATSSSSCGARAIHPPSRCARTRASSPSRRAYVATPAYANLSADRVPAESRVPASVGVAHRCFTSPGVVEGGVAVGLVGGRVEERVLLVRARGDDRRRRHHPERHALVAAGVEVAGVAQRHGGVGGVQRADVHVRQAAAGADEDLPQRPVGARRRRLGLLPGGHAVDRHRAVAAGRGQLAHAAPALVARAACFAAYACAASRTHAPSSCASRRCAARWALHGPLPLSTSKNSDQSISPKS